MNKMSYYWNLSRKIYEPKSYRENSRAAVFFLRAIKNRDKFQELSCFFDADSVMRNFINERDPNFQEVLTRVFLFKNSTAKQRLDAIKNHFTILKEFFSDEVIHNLYWGKKYVLWKSTDEALPLEAKLLFDTGQRKEGFLCLSLYYEESMVYHFNFRFDYNTEGEPSIYIGTLQGARDNLNVSKTLTKKFFGYRPKNFILYLMRIFVQTLGISNLYVITDEGFYTNSHILRGNRSKKTHLNTFWLEAGAEPIPEERCFWRMPIEEKRKKYEEIKTHKRNLFRKRYLLMDEIVPSYIKSVRSIFREGVNPIPSALDPSANGDSISDFN